MEVINPSIMMAPVGNFVCAIALASYPFNANSAVNYVYIARLWFAIAGFFAVVMFTVTFQASTSVCVCVYLLCIYILYIVVYDPISSE